MSIKNSVSKNLCCGCYACIDVCPTKCIVMQYNEKDWQTYPIVNENLCINCNKCTKICPALSEKKSYEFETHGYACVAPDEIREKSSSGGIFYIIAKTIINRGGYIVGAIFDKTDWHVKHIITNNLAELENIRGSKYVQSDCKGIYKKIESLLSSGREVLFTGTPCQVAALKNIVGEQDNLLTIDILCHGVPSQKFFDYYLTENFNISNIKNISFRNKKHRNGAPGTITIETNDGRTLYSEYFDNSYYNLFADSLIIRNSCLDCKFGEFPRVGDMSIGDFWGAKTVDTKIDYQRGCSICLINNSKGQSLWELINKSLKAIEEYPLNVLLSWNRNKRALKTKERRREIPQIIMHHKSEKIANEMLSNDMYDIGIFGVTMNPNFGGLITYYALYETLVGMGYSVVVLNKPVFNQKSYLQTHSVEFFNRHCNMSGYYKFEDINQINKIAETFVLGSDQVWNYNLFNCWKDSLYLDFIDNDKKKIAYAASFGHDYHDIEEKNRKSVSRLFKLFDYIGVREKGGTKILKEDYKVDSVCVLDPVFLASKEVYINLSENSELMKNKNNYVGSYIIEPNDFKLFVVDSIAKRLALPSLNITDGNQELFNGKRQWYIDRKMHIKENANIYDWLYIIINSDFIVTDSYHASCFCIIFNKPFILLQERWALSRIETLTEMFSLQNRWLKCSKKEDFSIDEEWFKSLPESINNVLNNEITRCKNWLRDAIISPKTILKNDTTKPFIEKNRIEDYFFWLTKKRSDFIMILTCNKYKKSIISKIDFKCRLNDIDWNFQEDKCFVMIFDYKEDHLIIKNDNDIEIEYTPNKFTQITTIVDNNRNLNTVFSKSNKKEYKDLQLNLPNISIYSKNQGEIIDTFAIDLMNGTAVIIR